MVFIIKVLRFNNKLCAILPKNKVRWVVYENNFIDFVEGLRVSYPQAIIRFLKSEVIELKLRKFFKDRGLL